MNIHRRIPRHLANRILHEAQSSPDAEICGLIGGHDGKLERCYRIANIAGDPAHLFEMDPEQQIDAMRQMRDSGEQLEAIYHSHPSSPAAPSMTDVSQSAYPDALYLIVSLNTTGVLELRGYNIRDKRIIEVELEIEE